MNRFFDISAFMLFSFWGVYSVKKNQTFQNLAFRLILFKSISKLPNLEGIHVELIILHRYRMGKVPTSEHFYLK